MIDDLDINIILILKLVFFLLLFLVNESYKCYAMLELI